MAFVAKAYLLTNKIQHYEWGERGQDAYIAKFLDLQDVDENIPLAELWMGTHPLGTSTLKYGGKPTLLSDLIQRYPAEILGPRVAADFVSQFPFLLKILSANEPLSIQLHPSKEQAVVLRQKDPSHYPDANHKPEIAIALEHLMALAGLRAPQQITELMAEYPALADFVEFDTFAEQPPKNQPLLAFQSLLSNAMTQPEVMVQVIEQAALHLQRKAELNYRETLFMDMRAKYPGDMGLLAIFFLKLHSLRKGEALFIPAGVPHAYLKGNIVECMASSDNVIRGGLTPKFKDIPALLHITTDQPPLLCTPDGADYTYPTPVNEFSIRRLMLQSGQKILETRDSVAILLILKGKLRLTWQDDSLEAMHGQSILLPASLKQIEIECLDDAEIYKADVP